MLAVIEKTFFQCDGVQGVQLWCVNASVFSSNELLMFVSVDDGAMLRVGDILTPRIFAFPVQAGTTLDVRYPPNVVGVVKSKKLERILSVTNILCSRRPWANSSRSVQP
jgi:hypothetical protein